jgi:hypothetical protein
MHEAKVGGYKILKVFAIYMKHLQSNAKALLKNAKERCHLFLGSLA